MAQKRPTLRASLAALALAAAGCAHLPRASEATRARGADEAEVAPRPEKAFVTGSRIARRVNPRSGLPETFSPVRVYTRADVLRGGTPADLDATLRRLDPTVGP